MGLKLINVERNSQKCIIEVEIFDNERLERIKLARVEDVHGDVKAVIIDLINGKQVRGKVNLGKYKRVSDLFAYGKQFQPVFDADIAGARNKTIFINKNHVVWAEEVKE
jgi:hypothetical protein